jgi:hypothetical protein
MKANRRLGRRRIEATPELIEAVLSDLARGLTREWACALNGISHDSWARWEKRPEFAELRARAIGARVKYLIGQLEVEENIARVKSLTWLLERTKSYQNQFALILSVGASRVRKGIPPRVRRTVQAGELGAEVINDATGFSETSDRKSNRSRGSIHSHPFQQGE